MPMHFLAKKLPRAVLCVLTLASLVVSTGCTSRGMTVTSVPPGAEVSINRRVVGVTPIRVNYTHYGTYRLEIRREHYQTEIRNEHISPPIYGYDPFTFFADNIIPARLNDEIYLHYVLKPVDEKVDKDALLNRAAQAREGKVVNPRTGEQVEIAMFSQPRPISTAAIPDAAHDDTGPSPTPNLVVPPAVTPAVPGEKPPEGPRLTKEFGPAEPPKPEGDKTATPAQPTPAVDPNAPKRMRRTPKGEILIYQDEPIEAPEKK